MFYTLIDTIFCKHLYLFLDPVKKFKNISYSENSINAISIRKTFEELKEAS